MLTPASHLTLSSAYHLVPDCSSLPTPQRRCSVDPGILGPDLAAALVVPQPAAAVLAAAAAAAVLAAAVAGGW